MINKRLQEQLFNPNLTYNGNINIILEDYPTRSKNLEKKTSNPKKAKLLNEKFIKDGYMYLLRGAKNGQESGFYSFKYKDKQTIESLNLHPVNVAYAQSMNGNTPFISATTNLYTAASFSSKERIYILKIPVSDVYTFYSTLDEEEYMIPDYIRGDEIIKSFRYDKARQIYNFLVNEVGLKIDAEDLGLDSTLKLDMDMLELLQYYNEAGNGGVLDELLSKVQECFMDINNQDIDMGISDINQLQLLGENVCRQVAIFTDSHGLLEPTEAILEDMKKRGITEIYSLGDNIGIGPNPKEVLDLLEKYQVYSIAGNHEEYINLGIEPFTSYLTFDDIENINWTRSQLSSNQIEKLKMLPHFIELTMAKQKIALCHFANDVRCDFLTHSIFTYQNRLALHMNPYEQFLYTNSSKQLIEIAGMLGLDIKDEKDKDELLHIVRKYIQENRKVLEEKSYLNGYLSYIEDPLFISNHKIKSVDDYNVVIQGHTHFPYMDNTSNTLYYSLRGVGMGYLKKEENLASYMIVTETENGCKYEEVKVPFDRSKMLDTIQKLDFPKEKIKKYTKVVE